MIMLNERMHALLEAHGPEEVMLRAAGRLHMQACGQADEDVP